MRVSVASKIGLGFASLVAVMTVSSQVAYQKVISIRVTEEQITGAIKACSPKRISVLT